MSFMVLMTLIKKVTNLRLLPTLWTLKGQHSLKSEGRASDDCRPFTPCAILHMRASPNNGFLEDVVSSERFLHSEWQETLQQLHAVRVSELERAAAGSRRQLHTLRDSFSCISARYFI